MPDAPLLRRDRFFFGLLVVLSLACGVWTELRSAYMQRRHTDLGIYLRASWAMRQGIDHYTITDNNGWHYAYPSLLAITLIPFADAPTGHPQPEWAVPYQVSVAVWYCFSLVLLGWSVQHLCRALEQTRPGGPESPPRGRRFLWTRTAPIWVCLPALGSGLVRGQVNVLLVALLSGCIAAAIRNRRATAGWWLAAAACLKVIPGLLILYPLVRRDWRMLGHFALGMVAGIVVIPTVVLGPEQALATTRTYVDQVIVAGLTNRPSMFSRELTDMTGTDNQSIRGIIHNTLNWTPATRPAVASAGTKLASTAIALAMIVWMFRTARRIADERYQKLFLLGGLMIVAVAATPVNHTHYMALALPAVLGLVYWDLERRKEFSCSPALIVVVALHILSGIYPRLPFLPGFQAARDIGVTMLGTLVVWWACLALPAASSAPAGVTEPARSGLLARVLRGLGRSTRA